MTTTNPRNQKREYTLPLCSELGDVAQLTQNTKVLGTGDGFVLSIDGQDVGPICQPDLNCLS